jgi:hypothetical protein
MNEFFPDYDCRSKRFVSRCGFIGGTASGFFGFAASHLGMPPVFANEKSRAKKLLVIWAEPIRDV